MTFDFFDENGLQSFVDYLRDVKMFDVYTGDKLGEGLKSVAISLSFRADDKTLSDDDIKKDIDSIISKLESKLGAKLRQ